MALNITPEQRATFEAFLQEHEPYDDDAPEVNQFDGNGDPGRVFATTIKRLLDGKIE